MTHRYLYRPNVQPYWMFWQNKTTHFAGDKRPLSDQCWPVSLLIFGHFDYKGRVFEGVVAKRQLVGDVGETVKEVSI